MLVSMMIPVVLATAVPIVLIYEMPLVHMEKFFFAKVLGIGNKKK